jgi:hypothetical protein
VNRLVPRLLAFVALLAVIGVTLSALRDSSRWRSTTHVLRPVADDPYRSMSAMLSPDSVSAAPRNPFAYLDTRVAVAPRHAVATPKPEAPAAEMPVLTAIVSDADPQAVIRFEGRSYTVGPGGLFADYRVVSVTADAVVLDHAGQQVVLQRPNKGE